MNARKAIETSTARCEYCGLPTRPSPAGESTYCCYGCRFAACMASSKPLEHAATLGPASSLGLSVFFTMNVVMLTMALWSYADRPQTQFEAALGNFLRFGAMMFSLPVLLLLGKPLFSHALTGFRNGAMTTDLLLSTGVLAAFAVSMVNTWRGHGHLYFEVGCVILVLVTLGRWMEATGRSQASAALDQLERLIPEKLRRQQGGHDDMVPTNQIALGDLIHVLAGERIPVDGCLVCGRGIVDEQFFTGESTPLEKQPGHSLLGGSLNLDGDLVLKVTSLPSAGALGRLIEAVRVARLSKGRYQLLSDAWSQAFFPIISVLAVGAFLFHGIRDSWNHGLLTSLSVVLIACPCALALATPMAVWTALGTAARRGVLCRSGAVLESLASVRAIRWDKTGTLTTGAPRVCRLICESPSEENLIERISAAMTAASNHLFSRAIYDFISTDAEGGPPVSVGEIRTIAGRGLCCEVQGCGTVWLGSIRWMDECGLTWGSRLSRVVNEPDVASSSIVALGFAGRVRGAFLLEESLRPEALPAMLAIRDEGLDQRILTGDRAARASSLALVLGFLVEAELLPEQKLAAIQAAQRQFGRVAMIGDGLNDAPALTAADIGIALGCGADVSRDSADICLLSTDLRLIPWAYDLSRRTVRTIRSNLAWSFGYNAIGVVVAMTGYLHPAMAAALMVISSLMVLGNSLRLSPTKSAADANGTPPECDELAPLAPLLRGESTT